MTPRTVQPSLYKDGMRLALYTAMYSSAETLTLSRSSRRPVTSAASIVCAVFAAVVAILFYSALSSASADEAPDNPRGVQSLDAIRAAAEIYIREAADTPSSVIIATAGDLDARLRLAACAGPLDVSTLNNAPIAVRNTVNVRCQQGANWSIYLPVSIETETDVLVLRQPAARLARIGSADVDVQRRRVSGLGNLYLSKPDELHQKHLKRSLPAGTVLTVDMLKRDMVIKRGQQVMLVANVGGIDVRAPGTALTDGGNADRIRVQNVSSLKVVEGVVESADQVRVGM